MNFSSSFSKISDNLDSGLDTFSFFDNKSNVSIGPLLDNVESKKIVDNSDYLEMTMLDLLKAVNFEPSGEENSFSNCDFNLDTINNIDLSVCLKKTVDNETNVETILETNVENMLPDLTESCESFLPSSNLPTPRVNLRPSLFAKALFYKRKREHPIQKVSDIKSEMFSKYANLLLFAKDISPNHPNMVVSFSNSCVLQFTGRRVYGVSCTFS